MAGKLLLAAVIAAGGTMLLLGGGLQAEGAVEADRRGHVVCGQGDRADRAEAGATRSGRGSACT